MIAFMIAFIVFAAVHLVKMIEASPNRRVLQSIATSSASQARPSQASASEHSYSNCYVSDEWRASTPVANIGLRCKDHLTNGVLHAPLFAMFFDGLTAACLPC